MTSFFQLRRQVMGRLWIIFTNEVNTMIVNSVSDYSNDQEKLYSLHSILDKAVTSDNLLENEFKDLRSFFINSLYMNLLPKWLCTSPDLAAIKKIAQGISSQYKGRREWLNEELSPLHKAVRQFTTDILNENICILESLDSKTIMLHWDKMLCRLKHDPEGAVTMARTLLESELKLIAEKLDLQLGKNEDVPSLYKKIAVVMKLSADQHQEKMFKSLLGSCSGIVTSISEIRNSYSDAHGNTDKHYKIDERLARFAVHTSGSLCLFLCETFIGFEERTRQQ